MSNPVLSSLGRTDRSATAGRALNVDDVVHATGVLWLALTATAAASWLLVPAPLAFPVMVGGGLLALALSLALSFSRRVRPAGALLFAVVEGLVLGVVSRAYASLADGVVVGAVAGTLAAFAGLLAAYKFFNIRVSSRFRSMVTVAMFGFVAVALVDFVLFFFGASFGFNGLGPMGLLASGLGVVLASFSFIIDFDDVETAVATGADASVAWRIGFGLTVSLVWMYTNLLRLLTILSLDD